jgi:integrase
MSRPRKPSKEKPRIIIKGFQDVGYAEIVGGIWKTRIAGGSRITTKIREDAGTIGRERVKAILQARINRHLAGTPKVTTIGELVKEYDEARVSKWKPAKQQQFAAARKFYLPDDAWGLEFDGIKSMLIQIDKIAITGETPSGRRRKPFVPSTRGNYLLRIRQLFDYAIEQRYIDRNPVRAAFDKPGAKSGRVSGYSAHEAGNIIQWFATQAETSLEHRRAWLFVWLQSLTGLRAQELATLPDDSITPAGFIIAGKGDRRRWFPLLILPELESSTDPIMQRRLTWLREIHQVIAEARALPRVDGTLLGITDRQAKGYLARARKALGMDTSDRRNTHALRKYAIWYWRTHLHLSRDVRKNLAGHSEEIARHIYDDFSPEEAARATILTGLI